MEGYDPRRGARSIDSRDGESRWSDAGRTSARGFSKGLAVHPLAAADRRRRGCSRDSGSSSTGCTSPCARRSWRPSARRGETLDCDWDVPAISQELAGNQILWRTRDMLLDGVSDERAEPDVPRQRQGASGRGDCPGQGLHGADQPLRGPHAAGALALPAGLSSAALHGAAPQRLAVHVPAVQTRKGRSARTSCSSRARESPTDSASSILRAARVLKAGMLLFLAGDVRWSGQMTEEAQFLGRTLRFSTTWVVLASMTGAPVVVVFCRIGPDRRYHIEFRPPVPGPQRRPAARPDRQLGAALPACSRGADPPAPHQQQRLPVLDRGRGAGGLSLRGMRMPASEDATVFPVIDVPCETELGYNSMSWSSPAALRCRQGCSMSPAAAVVVMDIGPVLEAP